VDTHDNLIAADGVYAGLWRTWQAGESVRATWTEEST
jgi:hypothetical protein